MIEPTRETDVRIAEAMGWHWFVARVYPNKQARALLSPDAQPFIGGSWVGKWDGDASIEPFRDGYRDVVRYTTDVSLVVLMMERMGKLTGRSVALNMMEPGDWSIYPEDPAYFDLWSDGEMSGDTANLACCAALLAVWERVKAARKGSGR